MFAKISELSQKAKQFTKDISQKPLPKTTHELLEKQIPYIREFLSQKVGPQLLNIVNDENKIRATFIMIHAFLPRPVQLLVNEDIFVDFCLQNRDKLLVGIHQPIQDPLSATIGNNNVTLQIAQRVQTIKPSPTLAVTARAAEMRAAGHDIIGLGAGEPDFDTPVHIKNAAIEAINQGHTKYTPVDGIPALKQAVINKFTRDNQLDYDLKQVMVSCGGKQTFYNMAQALLNPGDEAIIPAPYWVSYPDMVMLAGAEPVIVSATIQHNFKITPKQLEVAITDKTRLFVINSPSNPTGVHYSDQELAELGAVLSQYPKIVIATDDMYEHILWEGKPFKNILNMCPQLYDRTLVLNGVSKAYSMTGWRIGYVAGPEKLIQKMKTIQSQSTSNPTSISQYAALAALEGDQSGIQEMVNTFKERHDFVLESLQKINGVECLPSHGTFYIFPNMQGVMDRLDIKTDIELGEFLIEKAGVALVPGSAFGAPGYVRISFATSMDNLKKAIERLHNTLQ